MKNIIFLFAFIFFSYSSFSQTQQGRVKTRGRLKANGVVQSGQGISGATIILNNGSSYVSSSNGSFAFSIQSGTYSLKNVQKRNYQLCDRDLLNRDKKYSSNVLEIAMQTPEEALEDRLEAEEKIRATLITQLKKQKAELLRLKEDQKIDKQEYHRQLKALYETQNNNERLISEMAERYSTIDFDQQDEFQINVAFYIQNGKLTKADSLLNTRGSMEERSAEIERMESAIKADLEYIEKRQINHEKSVKLKEKVVKDFLTDCYSRFEICKLRHKNDSAAYWLELRNSKDPLNSNYIYELSCFYDEYCSNYNKSLNNYNKLLSIYETDNKFEYAYIQSKKAIIEWKLGHSDLALKLFNEALTTWLILQNKHLYDEFVKDYFDESDLWNNLFGMADRLDANKYTREELTKIYNCLNSALLMLANSESDLEGTFYYEPTVDVFRPNNTDLPEKLQNVSIVHGNVYDKNGNEITKEYYPKMLNELTRIYGKNSLYVAEFGSKYYYMFNGIEEDILINSINVFEELLGEASYKTLDCKRKLCNLYIYNENYQQAIDLVLFKINPYLSVIDVPTHYSKAINEILAEAYKNTKRYDLALLYYQKSIVDLRKDDHYDESEYAELNYNIGCMYFELNDKQNAINYYEIAIKTFSEIEDANDYSNIIEEISQKLKSIDANN